VTEGKDDTALVPGEEQLPERLLPTPDGWRIRRSVGHRTWQLAPPRAQPLVRVLAWTPVVALVGGVVSIQLVGHFHGGFWWVWMLGKGGVFKVGLVGAAGKALGRLSGRLTAWYLRTIAGLRLTVGSLRKRREGDLVRLRGKVAAGQSFTSAVSGQPAVLANYEVRARDRKQSASGFDEVRGIDFLVEIEEGETVRVTAEDAFLTASPAGSAHDPASLSPGLFLPGGTACREVRIGPGDTVELIGILGREVDPTADRYNPRELPTQFVLRGTRRLPLLVRPIRS
jgi:hypothetical protein